MPGALRALAVELGVSRGAGLTAGAASRLASTCCAFAALIEAESGVDVCFGPCFLLSVLSALRRSDDGRPLSIQDEAWVVAEVESELVEARARVDARAGRSGSAPSVRPALPARERGAT